MTMKHYFVVTGVDKHKNIIQTRLYPYAFAVAELLKMYSPEVAKTARDIEFEAQARASHGGAIIINNAKNYYWSIYYV